MPTLLSNPRALQKYGLAVIWLFGLVSVCEAEDVDTSKWQCQFCEPHDGWQISVEAGPGYVSDDAYKFGDFTGLDDSGFSFFGNVHARYWGAGATHFKLDGYRLGVDARAVYAEGGKQGSYRLNAFYRGVPRRYYDTGATPFSGNGGNRLTLPGNWVRASSTQDMTALGSSLMPVKIRRDWDIFGTGLEFTPTTKWTLNTEYKYTKREGKYDETASFSFRALQFIIPVDFETHDVTAGAAYSGDGWQLGLKYLGSFFDNDDSSVTFDNPYSSQGGGGDDTGRIGLPPNNWSQQLALTGSRVFPRRTIVTARAGFGYMKQDDTLLPYTSNLLIATSPLPGSSADAEVANTSVNLRATSSPLKRFTLKGQFRYRERDNKTSERNYDYVTTDVRPGSAVRNVAYDYKRYHYKLGSEYRFNSRLRLHAGYDHEKYKRNRQERKRTSTDRVWGKLKSRINRIANLDLELYGEWRDGSSYRPLPNDPSPQNPLMRKYNLADRDRVGVKLFGSLMVTERADLGMDFEYANDDYPKSKIGVTDASFLRWGVNGSYVLSDDASIYAAVYGEDYDTEIDNNDSLSAPDWFASSDDTFYTGTVGLKFPQITSRLGAAVDYTYSTSNGEIDTKTPAMRSSFPDLETDRHRVKLDMDYRYSRTLTYRFSYWYEDYDSDDWSLEGVGPDTVSSLLSLGIDPNEYDVHVFYLGVRYEFGAK